MFKINSTVAFVLAMGLLLFSFLFVFQDMFFGTINDILFANELNEIEEAQQNQNTFGVDQDVIDYGNKLFGSDDDSSWD